MGNEHEARKDLLKIPDHVALKYAHADIKRLEKRVEDQKDLILKQDKNIARERKKIELLKQYMEKLIGYSTTQSIFSKVGNQLKEEENKL